MSSPRRWHPRPRQAWQPSEDEHPRESTASAVLVCRDQFSAMIRPAAYAWPMVTGQMQATIIDGKALAARVKAQIKQRAEALAGAGTRPRLDAILVGGDGGARIYARNQRETCKELGIDHNLIELPAASTEDHIAAAIDGLNADPQVHAIMMHLPLPDGVPTEQLQARIDAEKDVEGVNPANIGNVVYGRRSLVPCTALAAVELIESTGIELPGAVCVCVGASNIVGKPVAILLMRAEATVISTNIHTKDIEQITRSADVLVSATGVPGLITGGMVKPGAVVIDVGIARIKEGGKSRTVGDVRFDEVVEVAGAVTPVPGGVGPMTVAMLLRNVVQAAEQRAAAHDV